MSYWFLAICVWPFTRGFARVVDGLLAIFRWFANLLLGGAVLPDTHWAKRLGRMMTKPWKEDGVHFYTYLVSYVLLMGMVVVTALYLGNWAKVELRLDFINVALVVDVICYIVLVPSALALTACFSSEHFPIRVSWNNRHACIHVAGNPSNKMGFRFIRTTYADKHPLDWYMTIPVSWAFGRAPKIYYHGLVASVRPRKHGLWLILPSGEKLLWGTLGDDEFCLQFVDLTPPGVLRAANYALTVICAKHADDLEAARDILVKNKRSAGHHELALLVRCMTALAADARSSNEPMSLDAARCTLSSLILRGELLLELEEKHGLRPSESQPLQPNHGAAAPADAR